LPGIHRYDRQDITPAAAYLLNTLESAGATANSQTNTNFYLRLTRILWLIVLTSFSLAPWIVKFRLGITGARHNRWHFAAFFITALVFSRDLFQGGGLSSRVFRSLAVPPMVAMTLEAFEVAFYHNRFEWRDVGVDWAGIAVGFAGLAAWQIFANPNRLSRISEAGRTNNT
jgi:hypothetical protein